METPEVVVERERERERVHKLLFGLVLIIGILLYAAFNVWVYQYSKSGKVSSPAAIWQAVTKPDAGFPGVTGPGPVMPPPVIPANAGIQSTITPSPSPTPRPTGPGEYACDPYGVCNKYGDEARRQYCTVTFADSKCLDQCGEKEKQCKN